MLLQCRESRCNKESSSPKHPECLAWTPLEVHLPRLTQVPSLAWEDSICHKATKPVSHNSEPTP